MITQTVDPYHYVRRSRQIRAQIPFLLSQWGLVAKFKRWRLAKDPESGLVVLFGVLDNRYIATHTTTPFSNYFDPHLLHDLETELQVKIISSSNDGLRYVFILERGHIDELPEHIDHQQVEDKLVVNLVFNKKTVSTVEEPQVKPALDADDQPLEDRNVGSYLKVFNDPQPESEVAKPEPDQDQPDFLIEIEKFKGR